MSRNNDTARNVHIAANVVNTGLFVWQARATPRTHQRPLQPLPVTLQSCYPCSVFLARLGSTIHRVQKVTYGRLGRAPLDAHYHLLLMSQDSQNLRTPLEAAKLNAVCKGSRGHD